MWHVFSNRTVLRITGIVLICTSVAIIVAWFFWLLPSYRRYDPLWYEQFTRKAYWKEVQSDIRRHGWTHDDSGPVGRYGDKSWAEWIMSKAKEGQEIADCGDIGHKDIALRLITCNDPAPGTNWNTETQWLGWWSTNKEKSQLEWIRSGLLAYGVSVQIPPSKTDNESLLALLGDMNTNATEKIPIFVKYNAFRWLRDSGFQAIPFAMSNITAQTPSRVREGLLEYGKFERRWPKEDAIGILEFVVPASNKNRSDRPDFYQPTIQITFYSLMFLPLFGGATLLVYSCRQRKKVEPNDPADGSQSVRSETNQTQSATGSRR